MCNENAKWTSNGSSLLYPHWFQCEAPLLSQLWYQRRPHLAAALQQGTDSYCQGLDRPSFHPSLKIYKAENSLKTQGRDCLFKVLVNHLVHYAACLHSQRLFSRSLQSDKVNLRIWLSLAHLLSGTILLSSVLVWRPPTSRTKPKERMIGVGNYSNSVMLGYFYQSQIVFHQKSWYLLNQVSGIRFCLSSAQMQVVISTKEGELGRWVSLC